jgi:hypothetical protein
MIFFLLFMVVVIVLGAISWRSPSEQRVESPPEVIGGEVWTGKDEASIGMNQRPNVFIDYYAEAQSARSTVRRLTTLSQWWGNDKTSDSESDGNKSNEDMPGKEAHTSKKTPHLHIPDDVQRHSMTGDSLSSSSTERVETDSFKLVVPGGATVATNMNQIDKDGQGVSGARKASRSGGSLASLQEEEDEPKEDQHKEVREAK